MKSNPSLTVRIDGHTDNIVTETYNLKLGNKRAMSARQYLVDQGVAAVRLPHSCKKVLCWMKAVVMKTIGRID